eukprot:6198926-Pleurochrysis_carterae.AAC.4
MARLAQPRCSVHGCESRSCTRARRWRSAGLRIAAGGSSFVSDAAFSLFPGSHSAPIATNLGCDPSTMPSVTLAAVPSRTALADTSRPCRHSPSSASPDAHGYKYPQPVPSSSPSAH